MASAEQSVVRLSNQYLSKLNELTTIYQHVWDISRKISEMEGDPLPEQLEQSVPGYAAWLKKHTHSLQERHWPFLLTGDNRSVLLGFLMSYLGDEPLSSLPSVCHKHYIYLGYHNRQYAKVVPNDPEAEPFIVQNWEGLGIYLNSLEERTRSESPVRRSPIAEIGRLLSPSPDKGNDDRQLCHHIEIYLPLPVLQGGLQFLIPPLASLELEDMNHLTRHVSHSHGLLYIMDDRQHMSPKLELLLTRLLKEPNINHHLLSLSSCMVVVHSSKIQKDIIESHEDIENEVMQYLPSLSNSSVISANLSCHVQSSDQTKQPKQNLKNAQRSSTSNTGDGTVDDHHNGATISNTSSKVPNSELSDSDHESLKNFDVPVTVESDLEKEEVDNVKNTALEGHFAPSDKPLSLFGMGDKDVKLPEHEFSSNERYLQMTNFIIAVNKVLQCTLEASVTSKCQALYRYSSSWLYSYVGRVMHHLRAFLNQAEKSQEERFNTHTEILAQLQQLTGQTDEFFSSLRKEVDSKVNEAIALLRAYLIRDDVIGRLSSWSEEEAPEDDIWSEVDHDIRKQISTRIRAELMAWEQSNQFFKNLSPCLIVHFEQRFVPIEHQLSEVETRIARHDSQVRISDMEGSDRSSHLEDEHDNVSWLPGSINLKWQQKVLLSVAAPVLFPLAVTLALLGLPIIGGLMAKDLIAEKLAENKLREYNADRVRYLRRRTVDEVTKFCRSRALEDYVISELEPAYQCVEQLQKIVPCQIEANKAQIVSLKNDFREAKDVERFYQPLVEVFDHYKMLLMLYKVLHMKRDKIDIDPIDLEVCSDSKWTCVGLKGSIKPGYLKDGDRKKLVSIKFFKVKLDIRNVDDYLQEEGAYRFQASTFIAKFLGLCKLPRGEFTHILEPLKCSLRQYVCEHNVLGALEMSEERQRVMKRLMLEVVRGLDYLHERGWVHFDLNMDSVCVDFNNRVKLINISSRRMYRLPPDLSHSDIYKYTHLPHEVLMTPPSAYTNLSEMYCVGIMMWELWTGERAYYFEIGNPIAPLSTMPMFVDFVEQNRPKLDMFYNEEGEPISKFSEVWVGRLSQCWNETDRLTSKAWLQLMDDSRRDNMPIAEQHFTS